MSTFEDREKGFESKFALDEEQRFRATARRNKSLGLWAAGLLGKSGEDAEAYAKEVVVSDLKAAGHDDIVEKVKTDLDAAGKGVSEDEIRVKLEDLMAQAVEAVKNG